MREQLEEIAGIRDIVAALKEIGKVPQVKCYLIMNERGIFIVNGINDMGENIYAMKYK